MYSLQVSQLIVIGIDADAEEEACISSIDDLGAREVLADQGRGCRG
jgi:hypothetical protein